MKNLRLPSDIHSRIVTYLNYTYDSMDQQKELKFFFDTMSPNLKNEVVRFIIAQSLRINPLLKTHPSFNQQIIHSIKLINCVPEQALIL